MLISSDNLKRAIAQGRDISEYIRDLEMEELITAKATEKESLYFSLEEPLSMVLETINHLSPAEIVEYVTVICQDVIEKRKRMG